MRILGLDLGERTIGVAVSDALGWTAQGVTTIARSGKKQDLVELRRLIEQYQCNKVVLGLPRRTDGSEGPEAERVRKFSRTLAGVFGIPVELWDERFSTKSADQVLIGGDVSRRKRKTVIDKLAAVIILQSYLDAHSGDAEGGSGDG